MLGIKKYFLRPYRRLAKAIATCTGHNFPFDRIDRLKMEEVIATNRCALSKIADWLPDDLLAKSVFRYGINRNVESLINLPLDNEVTHADLLAYFGRTLEKRCRYLELGVSVGKSLWQVMLNCAPCDCWGFDIEEINPALRKNLTQLSREEFPTVATSMKRTPSTITRFLHSTSGSTLSYLCADIFDEQAWSFLSGNNFNLVLSDALHTPEALSFEWKQITERKLLDPDKAIMIWDDLDGQMRDWFLRNRTIIAKDLKIATASVGAVFVNGWLGRRESLHRLGIAIHSAPDTAHQ